MDDIIEINEDDIEILKNAGYSEKDIEEFLEYKKNWYT